MRQPQQGADTAPLISIPKAARRWGFHPSTVYRWVNAGLITAYQGGEPVTPSARRSWGRRALQVRADALDAADNKTAPAGDCRSDQGQ